MYIYIYLCIHMCGWLALYMDIQPMRNKIKEFQVIIVMIN